MQEAEVQRYNELSEAGSVDPSLLVTVENLNMHALHDSTGKIIDIRYKNTGKSSVYTKNSTDYFYTVNPELVNFDIVNPDGNTEFKVDETNYFSKALLKSSQFGYNFKFNNNVADWTDSTGTDADINAEIESAKKSPADNAVYLKMGVNNIPTEPTPKKIEEFGGTEENGKDIYYTVTFTVSGGTYNPNADSWENPYTFDEFEGFSWDPTPAYTTDNPDNADLSNFTITGEVTEIDGKKKTVVNLQYNGKSYSVDNEGLKDNGDGTYSAKIKFDDGVYYNFIVNPGTITKEPLTVNIDINVVDGNYEDGELTLTPYDDGSYYSVSSYGAQDKVNYIEGLLDGILKVVDGDNEHTYTTLEIDETKVKSVTRTDDGNYTVVTNDGKTYEFIRDGMSFIYTEGTGEDAVTYNISLNNGDIYSTQSATITVAGLKVKGEEVTMDNAEGDYKVTGEAADYITELLNGVLEVVKNDDGTGTKLKFNDSVEIDREWSHDDCTEYTVIKDGEYYDFIKYDDGTYTYSPYWGQTYKITVVPGSLTYEVTVNVGDLKTTDDVPVTEGVYTVTNDNGTFLTDLINGKFKVVESADGTSTTLASENLTNDGAGNYTYTDGANTYNFTKVNDVYKYTADGINYEVTLEKGALEKTYNVNIEVSGGTFYINENNVGSLELDTAAGYTITKNADNFNKNLKATYNEPLAKEGDTTQVTKPYETTVTIANKDNNFPYSDTNKFDKYEGGYTNITKNNDGTYTLNPITFGNTTYNIIVKPGEVVSDTKIPVSINVDNGTITNTIENGVIKSSETTLGNYEVTNSDIIKNLLADKLEVVEKKGLFGFFKKR